MKDATDIRMAEATGYPVPVKWPVCPVCGEICRWYYKKDGEILGCDMCLEECNPEDEDD